MPSNRRELTAEMTHVSTLNAQLASAQDELLAKDAQLQQASFFVVLCYLYYVLRRIFAGRAAGQGELVSISFLLSCYE